MINLISSKKFLKVAKYIIILKIFSNIALAKITSNISVTILLALCFLLIINDLARSTIKEKNKWYHLSLVLSIIASAALKYYANAFVASIFMFSYAIEILYLEGRNRDLLVGFHGSLYLITSLLNIKKDNITEVLTVLGTNLLFYVSFIIILYLSHAVRNERVETKKLNEELKASNVKLQEYSLKVEELSIARERQRVAQELHDSLGHSLMALTMHLEFAEKIFDTNPEKAKEVILKARNISKDSTANLRMAVNTLKEERNIEDLSNAVHELISGFEVLGNIKIDFNMDKSIETLDPDIKLCLYKTIRESLTNGIKHGKATAFNLEIMLRENYVKLNIGDNGTGCNAIIKSNGLKGIENRISALGGKVDFSSRKNQGFFIGAEIPIFEETDYND